jgi:hypothetical protein
MFYLGRPQGSAIRAIIAETTPGFQPIFATPLLPPTLGKQDFAADVGGIDACDVKRFCTRASANPETARALIYFSQNPL